MEEKSPKGTLLVVGILVLTIVAMWLLVYSIMLRQA
ncbi:cytochrome c oxidase subunit 2A [Deinococcus misasensis]|nr:cytochrome c oxidase subunit 2A [Deinococcus misasensis]